MGKFTIFKGKDGQYWYNLKADNGQIILSSEGYTTKANAQNGIDSDKRHAADDGNFVRKGEAASGASTSRR